MNEIRLLDDSIINQIAAGEVVERPASVVKELAENALDSGATQLTIEVKGGGTTYIRVSDNGRGVSEDSLEMAFLRHATSKIKGAEDLEGVSSLGFRGEALASIAAVSQVEMASMTSGDDIANYIQIEGGNITKKGKKNGSIGTTLIVKNLFFNTPARRKFLKSNGTEYTHIRDIVSTLALGRPDIAITFINNKQTIFQTKGTDLRAAILQVMGLNHAKNVVDVEFQEGGIYIAGVAGLPNVARGNRGHEMFFINGRYVRSAIMSSALESAYRTLLPSVRFPFCVLQIQTDPRNVDVNVHPTKLEVRFSDENLMREAVTKAVEISLQGKNLIPRVSLYKGQEPQYQENEDISTALYNFKPDDAIHDDFKHEQEEQRFDTAFILEEDEALSQILNIKNNQNIREIDKNEIATNVKKVSDVIAVEEEPKPRDIFGNTVCGSQMESGYREKSYRIVGQFFGTYWIIEKNDSLFIIDQHAAHERVLYDEMMAAYDSGGGTGASQLLIKPFLLKLDPAEEEMLGEAYSDFVQLGFDIESFGECSYGVRGVPPSMSAGMGVGFFTDVLAKLGEAGTTEEASAGKRIRRVAMAACKAAVKANDHMSERECHALINTLMSLPNPYTCPHGRPTTIEITRVEIQRKFKRT